MIKFIVIYFSVGAIIAAAVCDWAKRHGERVCVADYLIWASLYLYYAVRLLVDRFFRKQNG